MRFVLMDNEKDASAEVGTKHVVCKYHILFGPKFKKINREHFSLPASSLGHSESQMCLVYK